MYSKLKVFAGSAFVLGMTIFISSCKEVNPTVRPIYAVVSTTYIDNPIQTPEPKNVLIEMITGVTCPNCPTGHDQMNALIAQYSPHVIGVEMHGGPTLSAQLDNPANIAGVKQILTCPDALSIVNALGGFPGSMPVQSMDRAYYSTANFGNGGVYDSYTNMAADLSAALGHPAPVNVNLSCVYLASGSNKQINIGVGLHYTTTQTDSDRLSILLTEDSIITSQEVPGGGAALNYIHMHILRAAVTNALGDPISVPDFRAGRADTVNYVYSVTTADSLWNPTNMHVIAFVNKFQHDSISILQSKTTWVTPH